MTDREAFEAWIKDPRFRHFDIDDIALEAWQASRRQALTEALDLMTSRYVGDELTVNELRADLRLLRDRKEPT